MAKVNEKEIYEVKGWLNDTPQNKEGLSALVGGSVTVEQLNVTENGTYNAPSGKAYSPVVVNVEGGSSDFSTVEVTFVNNAENSQTLYVNMGNSAGYVSGFYVGDSGITSDAIEMVANDNSSTSNNFFMVEDGVVDAFIPYNAGATVMVSGDVVLETELVEDSFAMHISGNCTITYSN